ncbi:MAG: gliding motility-associated protein GldM [Oceanospirillaceae bacterium]|jgi:gliding motility-associated protein GldM
MSGGKETPRQKMIGMMYLVLTALLALNVSKEILNSFVLINDSLEITNENFTGKNQSQYAAFDAALANDETKVKKWHTDAYDVKEVADGLVLHIEGLKQYLIMKTDKMDTTEVMKYVNDFNNAKSESDRKAAKVMVDSLFSLRNVNSKDNYDIATNIMIGGQENKLKEGPHTAFELVNKLNGFRDDLIGKLDPGKGASIIEALQVNFDTEKNMKISDAESEPWPMANFYHIPLAAVITNLSKIQTDVRNAESDVVKYLFREVDASDFKFDTLAAKIIAPNLVFAGDDYTAEIFVAAFSTTQNPEVLIGKVDTTDGGLKMTGSIDSTSVVVDRGVGTYTIKASSEGLKNYEGIIQVKSPSGQMIPYKFESEYMVMKTGVVVSPTKMNVLYIGVDNPISVSVPGVAPENVRPTLSGGSLTPDSKAGKGNYIAKVSGGKKATVSVSADLGGSMRPMGKFEFRVKRVPDPEAYCAGQTDGLISKNKLAAAGAVIPKMNNFDFDLVFRVTSFEITMNIGGDLITTTANGNRFTDGMKGKIKALKSGSRVYIENIKAVGPDGVPRKLKPIGFRIQ